jgi:endonuclease/exonuclease/phosphatase family metal-dependent hydrolase
MKRLVWLALAATALYFGWQGLQNGIDKNKLQELIGQLIGGSRAPTTTASPPARGNDTIRIATFNLRVFGEAKLNDPEAMRVIVAILKNFDVIALQEIRAVSQEVVPQLAAMLNADGEYHYDYALGPRLGRTNSKEQYAFLFDLASVEIDRDQLYTIDDPDRLLHRPPLVGWFRTRGPPPEQAFTFSLVTVHTDPDEVDLELDVLDDVFFRVRDDGRNEDDVVMLGDFNAKEASLRQLGQISGLVKAVTGSTPTNTRHSAQYDNILFHGSASTEFTGRAGVYDFLRDFNLSLQQAERISDHLPVWAEFSVFEGGRPGPLASRQEFRTGR